MDNLRDLGSGLKVAAVIAMVTAYAQVTDQIKQANAQLRLATRTQQELNSAQGIAYQIAQKNGTAYAATATLLSKNLKAANSLGVAGARAQLMATSATRAVAAGIRVSGVSAEEAKGALFQLGQALSSGSLRGDELNSIMEGLPALAEGLAKSMGRTTGELRKMGAEGKLSSAAVLEGLVKAQPELERLAALIPLTFGAAFQKVKNSAANLLGKFDEGTSLSSGLIASLDLISRALDGLAEHSAMVSNVVVGVLVAMAVRSVAAFRAGTGAAVEQAKANVVLATSARAAAVEQARQAAASLAVARAGGSLGAGGVKAAAAEAVAAGAQVAATTKQLRAAEGAAVAAARSSGLFGTAMVRAAGVARAALAMVGGPIGLIIAALAAVLLWAGKAAVGFQPIAGEAGTVGDYIAVAFEDATKWAGQKIGELAKLASEVWSNIGETLRPVAVWIVDAFMNVARGVAGAVQGIVEAWRAGANNISAIVSGLGKDASSAMQGNFTTANTSAALANSQSIGEAFGKGVQQGFNNTFKGVNGEQVVGDAVKFVKSIPGRISDFAKSSGYRDRANQRARDRAKAQEGGLGDLGKPVTPEEKKDKDKKKAHETTFAEILDDAKNEARLAGVTTAERERQSAVLAAQKTLKRDLTEGEAKQLRDAIKLRQTNEANLDLDNARLDVASEAAKARSEAAAEARRDVGDFAGAAAITAEIAVQDRLNQAKRDGITLDAGKLEAYRQAVLLASQEGEAIKQQAEARRQLKAIADEARNSIREAISGGIVDALSGKLSLKGLFNTFGNILKKQFAEQVTYAIFQGGASQSAVTAQAVSLVTPAATALAAATNAVTAALTGQPIADAAQTGAQQLQGATEQLSGVLGGAVQPLSEALGGILSLFGLMGKGTLMGGGNANPTTGIGKFFSATGPVTKGLDKIARFIGIKPKVDSNGRVTSAGSSMLGKAASGLAIGSASGQLMGMLGLKTSSTGSALGGMAGSLIGGPLGAAIGGALGGVIGGLFKKTAKSSATITSADGPAVTTGTKATLRAEANSLAGSVQAGLKSVAKTLGATLTNFRVAIGTVSGDYHVNDVGGQIGKKGSGDINFDKDAQAAIEYAIQSAIRQGALQGLSEGISEALKSGAATVQEVADFAAAKKDIDNKAKALTDPVGAALDLLDEQFNNLRDQYKKFGEDTTNLEKYYQDQRVKTIAEATKNELAALRSFRDELNSSELGGKSLGEQASFQSAAFKAIEDAKASGKTVDYEQVNTVGRALLDATRELEGNTPAYYAQVDRVMALLNNLIDGSGASNVAVLPPGGQAIDSTGIISATDNTTQAVMDQTDQLVAAVNNVGASIVRMSGTLAAKLESMSGGDYTDGGSNYQLVNFG